MSVLSEQLNQDELSLEDKLALIDEAMSEMQDKANTEAANSGSIAAPIDPADATMCIGCQ